MDLDATILAVSSPPGHSARGIVRCSGTHAIDLVGNRLVGGPPSAGRGVFPVRFRLEDVSVAALMLVTEGRASYTGEDTIELQVPGHPRLLARLVELLIQDGAVRGINVRAAQPGEFTARAFLSGRIALPEAESVAALVAARSDDEIQAADLMRTGRLGTLVEEVSDLLANTLALVEAGIDFTDEEDVSAIDAEDLHGRIEDATARLSGHLDRSVGLESLQSLPWVVLEGPPNAGKSTLFNALLGRGRAVVSGIERTTRDVLTEPMRLSGDCDGEVLLVDLAGEDNPRSDLEEAMQTAASSARGRAEVRVCCVPPGSTSPPASPGLVRVATMSDRTPVDPASVDVTTCGIRGEGLEGLRARISEHLAQRRSSLAADALVLAPRQEAALELARKRLLEAQELVAAPTAEAPSAAPELVAGLLREALNALGEINGVISPDEILDRVFSTFCIGK
ncbi:MAG: GTPase [Planctomycetota bacterium]|nr:GTPase [Planctomycetota bacterium]